MARGKYTLDGYNIIAFNQNLCGENASDLYFWNNTVTEYLCYSSGGSSGFWTLDLISIGNWFGSGVLWSG